MKVNVQSHTRQLLTPIWMEARAANQREFAAPVSDRNPKSDPLPREAQSHWLHET
jgi:hypothetical protein